MPFFHYRAVTNEGTPVSGEKKALTEQEVKDMLAKDGLLVVSIDEKKGREGIQLFSSRNISLQEKSFLFDSLHFMIEAGVSAYHALEILQEDIKNPTLKNVTGSVQRSLQEGQTIGDGLAEFPRHFSPLVINMVRVGEESGTLSDSLHLISEQYKQEASIIGKIRGAMTYPIVLILAALGVMGFLLSFVVPRFVGVFEQSGMELPAITKFTVLLSDLFGNPIFLIVFFFVLVSGGLFVLFSSSGKHMLSKLFARLPVIRGVYHALYLYRFCWSMGALMKTGVGLLESLESTRQILSGTTYEQSVSRIEKKISKGFTLSQAIREESIFPLLLSHMAAIGEETGNLDSTFTRLAGHYQEKFSNSIQSIITLVEPLLLIVIGIVVLFIVLSVILPMYTFITAI